MEDSRTWPHAWRGRWIWDRRPSEAFWWRPTPLDDRFVLLRRRFEIENIPNSLPVRVSCDARYVLHLNGDIVGRGPVRGEPEHLGWDELDLAPWLMAGSNVLVALCRFYGAPGPWWLPASPLGTLGRGSFCLDALVDHTVDLVTDERWEAMPAAWGTAGLGNMHAFPPEIVDGAGLPAGLHEPTDLDPRWAPAVVVSGRGHGTVLDRPPAAPYMTPLRRPIPQLTRIPVEPTLVEGEIPVDVAMEADPHASWTGVRRGSGPRLASVWDLGGITIGHVGLRIRGATAEHAGEAIDVVGGEDLREDGLPEVAPREWAARYRAADRPEQSVTFFDPIGLRYLAVHGPAGVDVEVTFEEARYPREDGASFSCADPQLNQLWIEGMRTVDVCATDAFTDCPGREQRAWVSDAYPQILVALTTNPDQRLVRHHLDLTSRSRLPGGLLAGAAGCDFARIGFTMPEYSLHWIRSVAAYWRYSGDEEFARGMLPIAEAIIERYELQRGASGLLEDFPGWVFLDWAQVDRDTVTATHDALYAAALAAYASLPGAADVSSQTEQTRVAFEALWDEERGAYVDAIGDRGRSRRMSQHTNGSALLAGIVPAARVGRVLRRMTDPASLSDAGRMVVTETSADARAEGRIPTFQYEPPVDFDEECDVVAAQPWFCRFLHEAYDALGRPDLIVESLRRWRMIPGNGTLQEFWDAEPGRSSRCHGWASSPTYDLTTYVLGARPVTPGWRTLRVDPVPGALGPLSAHVPTPHGWLTVEVDEGEVLVDLPAGTQGSVIGTEVGAGRSRIPWSRDER
ncbi:MAG: hypothetical protein ACR2K4_01735 [Candidatus Limnocylindria bacterium]